MNKLHKAIIWLLILMLLTSYATVTSASEYSSAQDLTPTNVSARLHDNSAATYETLREIALSSEADIKSVYLVFYKTAMGFTVSCGSESHYFEGKYLQYFADISECFSGETKSITITFDDSVSVCEVFAFGEGEPPEYVHNWNAPLDKADLLLFSSHADDEQLFFAGILPYYAGELGYRVQVAYFTDHKNDPGRRHELLNGLWTVGVRNYPVINDYLDQYSETYEGALANLKNQGYTEDDVIAYQTMLLRRFKPLVAIGHDLEGEYGHGQHKLNSGTLIKAVELAADETVYQDSAIGCGVWNTPKLYLHLYSENQIVMNWDIPLESFGGKTAFQVTQAGFDCHKSQHYTWFNTWLNGSSGTNTTAASISQHSPCNFGLYRSTVGEDINKNDFFENITTYAEQERIAAEDEAKRLAAEEQKRREEEESRKAAEEESRRVAEEEAAKDTTAVPEEKPHISLNSELIFAVVVIAIAIVAVVVTISVMKNIAKPKKKK